MKSILLAVTLALLSSTVSAQAVYTTAGTMAKGSRGATLVNANEAERRLTQTKQKRSQGLTPLPGESVKVPGGVLVNTRYWSRQEKLRLEVEQAQRRSNETQRLQLARQ